MEWAQRVKANLTQINIVESARTAAVSTLPDMRARIFDDGLDRNGTSIGNYSTKPTYISKSQMRNTSGGRETRGGKSKFFSGGYAQYKQSLGQGPYDLRNFGILMRDFLAPQETTIPNGLKLTFKQQRNRDIAENYPQAWGFNPTERKEFNRIFTLELRKRIFDD